ncbi:MAG: DNA alkylation repair protein [Eubacteriales bacterium]
MTDVILDEIIKNADPVYRDFNSKIVPNAKNMLGLRCPAAKKIAKKYANTDTGTAFLSSLPHEYHDENMVHGYMLGFLNKDMCTLEKAIDEFLPHIDNWAVCDTTCLSLKRNYFKNPDLVYEKVKEWAKSDKIYTVRFALVSLLSCYIEKNTVKEALDIALTIKSDEYYIKMAQAWLISVALVKCYEDTLPYITEQKFDKWVHNKGIQKALESYRISDEQKAYLRSLKIK